MEKSGACRNHLACLQQTYKNFPQTKILIAGRRYYNLGFLQPPNTIKLLNLTKLEACAIILDFLQQKTNPTFKCLHGLYRNPPQCFKLLRRVTMNKFMSAMKSNDTLTANGMVAHSTTGSDLLDLFSTSGALREADASVVSLKFQRAFSEDYVGALKAMFYCRDIRGGQGERKSFRIMFRWLCVNKPEIAFRLLGLLPFYGRWDDVLVAIDTPVQPAMVALIREALIGQKDGTCAKWMPREGKANGDIAVFLARELGLTARSYRLLLSRLTKVVENQMCAGNWSEINYSHVPSQAMHKYMKAYWRNDGERYGAFVDAIGTVDEKTGEVIKMNAGAIFPHETLSEYLRGYTREGSPSVEAQWKAQPDFIKGEETFLPICDVSGSMEGLALEVSIALGIYLSERNKSSFKNAYVIFSGDPVISSFDDNQSVFDKVRQMSTGEIARNTNLERVYRLMLEKAKQSKLAPEDMPSNLLIMSDMQFDSCIANRSDNATKMVRRMYAEAGYAVPNVIYWNVRASANQPAKLNDEGVVLVSGFSPSIMKSIFGGAVNPMDVMYKVLNDERYSLVEQALK
jgi:hypothetical protein